MIKVYWEVMGTMSERNVKVAVGPSVKSLKEFCGNGVLIGVVMDVGWCLLGVNFFIDDVEVGYEGLVEMVSDVRCRDLSKGIGVGCKRFLIFVGDSEDF